MNFGCFWKNVWFSWWKVVHINCPEALWMDQLWESMILRDEQFGCGFVRLKCNLERHFCLLFVNFASNQWMNEPFNLHCGRAFQALFISFINFLWNNWGMKNCWNWKMFWSKNGQFWLDLEHFWKKILIFMMKLCLY